MLDRGLLISFAGLDGTGKTTHSALLCKWLEDKGYNALDMPNIPVFSNMVFNTIAKNKGYCDLNSLIPKDVIYFSEAIDRVKTYTIYIQKMIEQKAIIIMPSYYYNNIVIAMFNKLERIDLLLEIYDWLPKPDITFYMDVKPSFYKNNDKTLIYSPDEILYNEEIINYYMKLDDYNKFVKIDPTMKSDITQELIRNYIDEYINSIQK